MWMHADAAWRSILEALGVAAGDHSVQVVSGALVALQQVIDLLFQVRFLPVLAALKAGVQAPGRPHEPPVLSMSCFALLWPEAT